MARQTKAKITITKLLAKTITSERNQKVQEELLLMKKIDGGMMTKGQMKINTVVFMHHHRERSWFLEGRSRKNGKKKTRMMMIYSW